MKIYEKDDITAREVGQRVETFKVTLSCEVCGIGSLNFTGVELPMGNPLEEHKCNNCGEVVHVREERYPKVVHKAVTYKGG